MRPFVLSFVLAVLATWRVTHLLASEDGPGDLIVRFRRLLGDSWAGQLMDCFYCLSLWVAAPAAWFVSHRPLELVFTWLAISGGACLLERIGKDSIVMQTMPPKAVEGEIDNVLRPETLSNTDCLGPAESAERPTTRYH